jgi:hypothetical protein
MGFFRDRVINGRTYRYYEERWREDGKVRSRSTIVKSVGAGPGHNWQASRKDATERYRDTLRENVFLYGRSYPGERYEAEARAREAYQEALSAEQRGEVYVQRSPEEHLQDVRAQFEHLGRAAPSASARAEGRYMANRAAVKVEDDRLDKEKAEAKASYPPKGTPTEEEEAKHADATQTRDDYVSERAAEWSEVQADEASAAPAPDSQADTPDA